MSHVTSVLINSNESVNQIGEFIAGLIGHNMEVNLSGESKLFKGRIMGVLIYLYDKHEYDDDGGIQFSKYQYILDYKCFAGPPVEMYQIDLCRTMGFISAITLMHAFKCECVVIDNLQKVLGVFNYQFISRADEER